jgi:cytoskeletal protein RodZ
MSERTMSDKAAEEKLGEYLKRARLAAGIELAELAREIRITPDMLDHLENGRYEKLPVQAYVRGYLNTICTRLELNRSKVLDWYAGEVGRTYAMTISTDLGIEPPAKASVQSGSNKVVIAIGVGILMLFVLVLNIRKGDESSSGEGYTADSLDSVAKADSIAATQLDSGATDTVGLAPVLPPVDSSKVVAPDTAKVADAVAAVAGETTLKFECNKDSTWIRVKKVGGLSWARVVSKGDKPRFLSHSDTMKVSIGSPEKTSLSINDEKVKIPSNYFKVYNGKIVE